MKIVHIKNCIRRKENLKKLFYEFIAAFMGVLIAMGLSNWQENREENDFIKRSITSIYKDNLKNIESVQRQIDELETHIDTFNYYKKDEKHTLLDLINKNEHLILQSMQFDGWEMLERSNLVYKLDYKVASKLFNLNDQSDIFLDRRKGITDMLYKSSHSTASKDKKTMKLNFTGLKYACNIYLERAQIVDSLLQISYKEYLAADTLNMVKNKI